jgi:hypothetical protein
LKDRTLQIDPKSKNEIEDYGRSQRHAGDVNKVLSDRKCRNPHSLSYPGTNPEKLPFNEMLQISHTQI